MWKWIVGIIVLWLVAATLIVGMIETETEYGKCIGLLDDADPKLVYQTPARNIVIGAIFFEFVLPPAYVIFTCVRCPVGAKGSQ